MHFNIRSVNSMAGFPRAGKYTEIGHRFLWLAGPGSLSPFVMHHKGPDRF
jgi:hypothetical protein